MEKTGRLHYGLTLRLYFEEKAFGPGMVVLLEEVERTGSLQRAARSMNMATAKLENAQGSGKGMGLCPDRSGDWRKGRRRLHAYASGKGSDEGVRGLSQRGRGFVG